MEHSINELFKISMASLENMLDVNTVVGDAKVIGENVSVIPISTVKCSYVTGGLENKKNNNKFEDNIAVPFGGASGGSLTIVPVAFLVVNNQNISILHLDDTTHLYEKIIDTGVDIFTQIKKAICKKESTE